MKAENRKLSKFWKVMTCSPSINGIPRDKATPKDRRALEPFQIPYLFTFCRICFWAISLVSSDITTLQALPTTSCWWLLNSKSSSGTLFSGRSYFQQEMPSGHLHWEMDSQVLPKCLCLSLDSSLFLAVPAPVLPQIIITCHYPDQSPICVLCFDFLLPPTIF